MSTNYLFVLLLSVLLATLTYAQDEDACSQDIDQESTWHRFKPKAVKCTIVKSCGAGFTTYCDVKKIEKFTWVKGKRSKGFLNKCVRTCKPDDTAGGSGDPHLTSFDGKRFDFQGVAGSHYMVFSKSAGGDQLVTRMRGSPFSNHGSKATYFDAFGLSVGSHKIMMETVPRPGSDDKWSLRVRVNGGDEITDDEFSVGDDEAVLSMNKQDSNGNPMVIVTTKDAEYKISAKKMWRITRHLDISMSLKHTPSKEFKYDGLLGHTLNGMVGNEQEGELAMLGATRDVVTEKQLEQTMRSKFITSSLFPVREVEDVKLNTVHRMASYDNNNLSGFTFTASIVNKN